MRRTNREMAEMAQNKINSPKTVDRLVADELLEMGFSYNHMGTHYLHDSIVQSAKMSLEDFKNVSEFCLRIAKVVCRKYSTRIDHYSTEIAAAIERAFEIGNVNYLLDIFKNSYDRDKMKVTKNAFIMTVRKKIVEELERQNSYSATQLRIIIQGELEKVSDIRILQGMCDIVLSLQQKII